MGEIADSSQTLLILIDTKLGGSKHDLTQRKVTDELVALARHPLCAGVMASFPCRTWCAGRFNQPGPCVLRKEQFEMGVENLSAADQADVDNSNLLVSNGAEVLTAANECNVPWILECPISRSSNTSFTPQQAIKGREEHVSMITHDSLIKLINTSSAKKLWFDGCAVGHSTQKTTMLVCSTDIFPHVHARFSRARCTH
jgi:hypothetical protein